MSMQRLSASGGCQLISTTDAQTGKFYTAFVVQEDTVVSVLAGGEKGSTSTNFITEIGLSGKTLKQGALIVAPDSQFFSSLTLTSGSVIAYKE